MGDIIVAMGCNAKGVHYLIVKDDWGYGGHYRCFMDTRPPMALFSGNLPHVMDEVFSAEAQSTP